MEDAKMKQTIEIELGGNGAVGTRATVTNKRWWRGPAVRVYVCHRGAALLSAEWIDAASGRTAEPGLSAELNEASQAAARLAGKA